MLVRRRGAEDLGCCSSNLQEQNVCLVTNSGATQKTSSLPPSNEKSFAIRQESFYGEEVELGELRCDADFRIVAADSAALKLLGYTTDAIVGKSITHLMSPLVRRVHKEIFSHLKSLDASKARPSVVPMIR